MARRNRLLEVRVVDPDREPALARAFGVRIYNAGVLEADGRKLQVQTTDENEIALGIQRVLRERVVTVCFLEGHDELPMDNFEFHTHVEGVVEPQPRRCLVAAVQMPGHGIGRLRRALEAQGYEARKVVLATGPRSRGECQVLIVANPRTTFLPAESAASGATCEAAAGCSRCSISASSSRGGSPTLLGAARRGPAAGGGHRPAEPLRYRQRDGRGDRLRGRPDHAQPVDDVLSRRPAARARPPAPASVSTPLFAAAATATRAP